MEGPWEVEHECAHLTQEHGNLGETRMCVASARTYGRDSTSIEAVSRLEASTPSELLIVVRQSQGNSLVDAKPGKATALSFPCAPSTVPTYHRDHRYPRGHAIVSPQFTASHLSPSENPDESRSIELSEDGCE